MPGYLKSLVDRYLMIPSVRVSELNWYQAVIILDVIAARLVVAA